LKILVLSINYAPEATGFAPHITAASEYFVAQGHSVSVVTGFPFSPNWARWPKYRGRFIKREILNGVEIVRITHFIPARARSIWQRLLMEGSFCLLALPVILLRLGLKRDLILYVGAQPSIALLARSLAVLSRAPYMVNINDLAAQAAGDVGIVRKKWQLGLLNWIEFQAYTRASGAMVLCGAFRDALVANGYPSDRIRLIPPPVDLASIRPVSAGPSFRAEHDLLPSDFIILYSGSMGLKQDLPTAVEAARLLKHSHPEIKWILVGDGERRAAVAQLIVEAGLDRVMRILPLQPIERMSSMYAAADVLLLGQLKMVKDTVIPSKLLAYMAAGRPILAAVNASSQGAVLLRGAQGGVLVIPENPAAMAAGVIGLQADRVALAAMGRRNRVYAEEHFDQHKIMAAQEHFLRDVLCAAKEKAQSL
jgi:colanic acid biosynthesis glycosyl transferase WcaI